MSLKIILVFCVIIIAILLGLWNIYTGVRLIFDHSYVEKYLSRERFSVWKFVFSDKQSYENFVRSTIAPYMLIASPIALFFGLGILLYLLY